MVKGIEITSGRGTLVYYRAFILGRDQFVILEEDDECERLPAWAMLVWSGHVVGSGPTNVSPEAARRAARF